MDTAFRLYNHLGFHNPYCLNKDGGFLIDRDLHNLIKQTTTKTLDYTALVQILSTGYAFGDRTLIKEVKKTPWMARPNKSNRDWEYFNVPKHGEKVEDEKVIAQKFYNLLEKELLGYIRQSNAIGVLLTGGMDSRIVAAVLHNVIKRGKVNNKSIYTYTWGAADSRDVVYAKRISELYHWEWRHIEVDVSQMKQNYRLTIKNGCEFTPIHLHAMSKLLDEDLDCVLAGSFGDSVGRAEFSSVSVQNLKSLKGKVHNFSGLLRSDFVSLSAKEIKEDIEKYHSLFPQDKLYQLYEQDLQLHYMRRMLNSCMSIINEKTPLYQMFASPEVFGYMWSIHPEKRNNLIYKYLLDQYAPELMKIPWARTGLVYPETEGTPDGLKKRHHEYGKMIRTNFMDMIEYKIIENKDIVSMIFNYKSIMRLIKNIKKYPIKDSYVYEEKLFWIAAVLEFIKENRIKIELPNKDTREIKEALKNDLRYKGKYFLKEYVL